MSSRYPREAALLAHYEAHLDYGSSIDGLSVDDVLARFDVDVVQVGRALDVGCGDGRFARALAALGVQVTGVDYAPSRIARARELAAAEGLRCRFVCDDLHDALQAARPPSWDLIALFEVLEHLEAPEQVVARCRELLAPGGVLIGTVPLSMPYVAHLQVYETLGSVEARLQPEWACARHGHAWCRWSASRR